MSKENMPKPSVVDVVGPAYELQASLNARLAAGAKLDKGEKIRTRNELKKLMGMMSVIEGHADEISQDVVDGMHDVIQNTEALLTDKPMHFKGDDEQDIDASSINQMAA
jgi:hypothetical protein